ncbi:protein phosphatase Slingshot isoform X2 [Drosophila pseudoobscura]|uniref:protein-serine/threonine phosphatase n=1 Tax=Drosophila pseudoobscura pseudoobscura TaxID=46245 RepID=A0A6I8VAI7_DROPS|nr:protein phosphatase Slingshot isoform X2 [Drosophila pseudoobscura]
MALVTVQRSPSVAGSGSNSDGEADDDEGNSKNEKSECFFAGKGTALVLALKDIPPQQQPERRLSTDSTRSSNSTQSNNSDIQLHLQSMFFLLHREDTLKMAVKLESQRSNRTRYLVIASRSCCRRAATSERRRNKIMRHNSAKVSSSTSSSSSIASAVTTQRQHSEDVAPSVAAAAASKCDKTADKENVAGAGDNKNIPGMEESCLLGIDCNERTTIGLVVPILADTTIHLDGDGGFSVAVFEKTHIFKPVSVQAMWSALQTIHKVSKKARENNFYASGPSHDWLSSYERRIESDQSCLNEWNAMDALESRRPPSPDAIRNKPTEKEETESVIKMKLKAIMMSVDLDEVTSKYIRGRLEEILDMDLGEYKSFIDAEMLVILGQMDAPTKIFEHVYLGSEWNASNLEELQKNGVRHILNVTREIDNFFPGTFEYFNVRVYDDEKTNLLKYWDDTYRYITRAKAEGSKVLVHCKMGVSRSASVVIAYAMKAYKWEFQRALDHVKERRSCIKPNKNFLSQLETYSGMLDAMKNKEKLQRSKSETNLKSTKDARLLPGSEPTPLIQALNQAKSKSSGEAGVVTPEEEDDEAAGQDTRLSRLHRRSSAQKQRRMVRRSSSTSPKTQTAVVTKQQSQSMENLTPERSVAEEPKNMRFPGSNGENYSVTQNQVLHIQKHTPLSVRTRVHDLEAHRSDQLPQQSPSQSQPGPVWTSLTKLITQTSHLGGNAEGGGGVVIESATERGLPRRDSSSSDVFSSQVDNVFAKEEREKRQRRKTHSWTEAFGPSGGIILDATPQQSQQHQQSIMLRNRGLRQREPPSRHSSWGSGDNRSSLPLRTSSGSYYDSNRNTTAIFEGEIQDLKRSSCSRISTDPKTASNCNVSEGVSVSVSGSGGQLGTVKRTKQKLEESTVLKKRCPEDAQEQDQELDTSGGDAAGAGAGAGQKRSVTLYRSASSANSPRQRQPLRCNSEELMHTSDIENKNTTSDLEAATAAVVLRGPIQTLAEDQRISGNVQILKQNFEAKAAVVGVGSVAVVSTVAAGAPCAPTVCSTSSTAATSGSATAVSSSATAAPQMGAKKTTTHQSLPSSPVAQHANHVSSSSSSSTSNSSDSSVSENCDRNVKGLVHKYQTTSCSSQAASQTAVIVPPTTTALPPPQPLTASHSHGHSHSHSTNCNAATNANSYKQRPRSYYDRSSLSNKTHDYSESRPPPAPARLTASVNYGSSSHTSHVQLPQQQSEQQQQHQQVQIRRLAQHGKTHPLTRLSTPKPGFNTAAYNTILIHMIRSFRYSWAEKCSK